MGAFKPSSERQHQPQRQQHHRRGRNRCNDNIKSEEELNADNCITIITTSTKEAPRAAADVSRAQTAATLPLAYAGAETVHTTTPNRPNACAWTGPISAPTLAVTTHH